MASEKERILKMITKKRTAYLLFLTMMAIFGWVCDGNSSSSGITGASCVSTGTVTVYETIRVTSGVYDGGCKTFNATSALGDGSQAEDQDPVFRVENGATLKNVIIGRNGADGIHLYNGATVDNVIWTDVGEDAMTVKSEGTYAISNIEGYDAVDKFFQINAPCTFNVRNAIIHRAGKALRQNGGTTFEINVTFDRCEIQDMDEGVFRSDSYSSTARITNSCLANAGDICIGNWANCTYSNITYGTCADNDDEPSAGNSIINGIYSILAIHSGKALDTWAWGTEDGTNIAQYSYWGGQSQQFEITPVDGIWHRITPVIASDQAMNVAGCVNDAGANIQTGTYWGGDCQQFRFQDAGSGRWRIIARNSGLCLDILNASTEDGANVIQYPCISNAGNQMFKLEKH
jgi:hypothetical protein